MVHAWRSLRFGQRIVSGAVAVAEFDPQTVFPIEVHRVVNAEDFQLIREYTELQSDAAFEKLVGRYVNLVYSAAIRQVGDPHLAEEVTQTVFIILARKAKTLGPKVILSGWLYRTAQYISGDALRSLRRRQKREQEAYMQSITQESGTEVAWEEIAPLLDEGLADLREMERD